MFDIDPALWPRDYFDSRKRFTETAQHLIKRASNHRNVSLQLDRHSITAEGPTGEQLSVDVLASMSSQDSHCIVVCSGLHGVEGFIGASLQLHLLKTLCNATPFPNTSVVLIHAANPYGFAHLRRVDENNVDLNRNFIDFHATRPHSHKGYAALNPIINASKTPGFVSECSYWPQAIKHIVRNGGLKALAAPIAQGQYDFPKGLFFGGERVSESTQLLQTLVLKHTKHCERVSIIDVHTGLGNRGSTSFICNTNQVAPEERKTHLSTVLGQSVVLDDDAGNAYAATGTFASWCAHALEEKSYLYVCNEIGTVNPISLFSALRRENQAHHWCASHSPKFTKTKQSLKSVFSPSSLTWRSAALESALSLFYRVGELS